MIETYVETSRCQRLAGVIRLGRHLCHIKDEVSNLPKELVLVDVPDGESRLASSNTYIHLGVSCYHSAPPLFQRTRCQHIIRQYVKNLRVCDVVLALRVYTGLCPLGRCLRRSRSQEWSADW